MAFGEKRDNFKFVAFGLVVLLVIIPLEANEGVTVVKIKNITVSSSYRYFCTYYNATLKWILISTSRNETILFKIWLTSDSRTFANVSMPEFRNENVTNSFEYTFADLAPAKKYTAHVASYTSMKNFTSYANSTFDIGKRTCIKAVDIISTNYSEENGYLVLSWGVPRKYRNWSTPVVYNVSLCPSNVYPSPCNSNKRRTVCKAVYHNNGSASSGEVQLFEKNWQKFVHGQLYKNRPLYKVWNKQEYRFTCGIFLNVCSSHRYFEQLVRYDVDFGDNRLGHVNQRTSLEKGYSYKPDFINISYVNEGTYRNKIGIQVHWRFQIVCEPLPANELTINLLGKTKSKVVFYYYDLKSKPKNDYVEKITKFTKLVPYSVYTVEMEMRCRKSRGERTVKTKKVFRTPEGVPVSTPIVQPILDTGDVCIENKRNVTVKWKLPPEEDRNGIVRNITLRYFPTKSEELAKEISMANVTSTELIGLYCTVSYKVQLRACLHANDICSKYSKPQVIRVKGVDVVSESSTIGSISGTWWAIIAAGAVIIVVALAVCLYYYRRKRRRPLPALTEETDKRYENADNSELSRTGEYLCMENEIS